MNEQQSAMATLELMMMRAPLRYSVKAGFSEMRYDSYRAKWVVSQRAKGRRVRFYEVYAGDLAGAITTLRQMDAEEIEGAWEL